MPKQILVTDDDDMVRMVMSAILTRHGFQVEEAANGHEAIEKFTSMADSLDLVMVDQNMPGMSGLETLQELRQVRPNLKAVILSGAPMEDEDPSAKLTHYLSKPFENDELIRVVETMLPGE